MKKFIVLFVFILMSISFNYCDKNNPIASNLDKQIQIPFPSNSVGRGVQSDSSDYILIIYEIIKFNIDNYPGVDSIVFVTKSYNEDTTYNVGCLDLFNVTDSLPINNSMVIPGRQNYDTTGINYNNNVYHISSNFYKSLPHKEIDIAPRTKRLSGGHYNITYEDGWLILYRK